MTGYNLQLELMVNCPVSLIPFYLLAFALSIYPKEPCCFAASLLPIISWPHHLGGSLDGKQRGRESRIATSAMKAYKTMMESQE
jgi:hypothetical protein